ncbi:ComEC/Rec2 family competence protein [Iodidimonas sp. SYSU 1G8]|uniref:ComEC/Rec2 family competence protein n=1 Tax=Iodidimonas sp. SYSU 1G8 TaxID=3133967 RepID=UPI0031FEFC24
MDMREIVKKISKANSYRWNLLLNSLLDWIKRDSEQERDRWVLWMPVLGGVGIAGYFAAPVEPSVLLTVAGLAASLALLCITGRRYRMAAVALLCVMLGFAAAVLHARWSEGPVLDRETRTLHLSGRIDRIERFGERDIRLTLSQVEIAGWTAAAMPVRVRIGVRTRGDDARPGDTITVRARLLPPAGPSVPGGYDFGRQAWFERIGAVGYAIAPVRIARPAGSEWGWWRVARFRDDLGRRLLAQTGGDTGAMSVALVTGERAAITEETLEQLRIAGIAHLLAISGMNIALMTGFVFVVVRFLLACVPGWALRYPIKQWAAIAGLMAGALYLMVSGAAIPTQRAFLASSIVFIGILLNRIAITMRLVAITGGLLLLIAPQSLLNVSFQMSFAAVVALVAIYEKARVGGWLISSGGLVRKAWIYLVGVAVTSLAAGAATGFFAAYHFNNFATYGLLTNMIAVPLMGVWIMPCVLAIFIALPFGLEGIPLRGVEWGVELTLHVARWVAALPGADIRVQAMPVIAMPLVVSGGLWLLLWTRSWRWLGLLPIACGVLAILVSRGPEMLVDEKGKMVAIRGADGRMAVIGGGRNSFARETWLRRDAQKDEETQKPEGLSCDSLGCVYRTPGHDVIALVQQGDALAEDCARADILISAVPTFWRCRGPAVVIDRFDLWRGGAHAIWFDDGVYRVQSVAAEQGTRPWSLYARRVGKPGDQ